MTTTMDIAVCFDCSSSIAFYSTQIRRILRSIFRNAFLSDENDDVRMALIEFQSHTDEWVTNVHPFTSSIDTFQQWINAVRTEGRNSDECKAIADAISVSLTLDWRSNDKLDRYHEKLVILITDGPPCNLLNNECPWNNNDLWKLSDELERQDIKLVVIGIEPCVVVCDDFYCALANKTGGEYLPLINASRVLSFVIEQAILEEDTLSQLFRHLDIHADIEYNSLYHYSYVEKRARFMIEYCQTMNDIRKLLYTYCRQSTEFVIDGNISEPHSPGMNLVDFDYFYGNANIITSTPITDDEGYRTRLPTTASADSSFIYINTSPVLSHHRDLEWNSVFGDESD